MRLLLVSSVLFLVCTSVSGVSDEQAKDTNFKFLHACGEGDVSLAKALLKDGADVNAANEQGETPLHVAGIKGNDELIEFLIKSGANVNARATGERSLTLAPLHWYVWHSHTRGVESLLKAGCEVNAVVFNEQGDKITALDISKITGQQEIISLIEKYGGKTYEQLREESIDKEEL